MTCADAVRKLLKDKRRWEVRSAGKGSRGERWYAQAWIATASPQHHLLVRRHLKTGELAFHAGVKRQYMGCAGRVANGINTVHVSPPGGRGHGVSARTCRCA